MQLRGINANKRAQCADRSAVNTHRRPGRGLHLRAKSLRCSERRGGGGLNHLTDELNVFASLSQQLIPLMTVLQALELRPEDHLVCVEQLDSICVLPHVEDLNIDTF